MNRCLSLLLAVVTLSAACGKPSRRAEEPEPAAAGADKTMSLAGSLAGPIALELVDDFNIPPGTSFAGIEDVAFGGISGLFFDPGRMKVVAISDNRADNRYFTIAVRLDGETISFIPESVTYLVESRGAAATERAGTSQASMPRRVFDPESIALAPNGNLFVSTEGIAARRPRIGPTIAEFRPDGELVRFLPVPEKFVPEADGAQTQGAADNLAFESLTVSPDGSRLFAATEAALVQDDTPSSFDKGSHARLLEIGLEAERFGVVKEYVYPVEPMTVPADFGPGAGENGLVELLALGNSDLLALERKFIRGGAAEAPRRRNVIRIFRISLEGATDVSDVFSLRDQEVDGESGSDAGWVPVSKELVLDLDDIVPALSPEYPELDNFEGMCLGPILPDGSASLIVVSDDNFNPWQRTAFLLFRILPE